MSLGYQSKCRTISTFRRHLGLDGWHPRPRSNVIVNGLPKGQQWFSFVHRRYILLDGVNTTRRDHPMIPRAVHFQCTDIPQNWYCIISNTRKGCKVILHKIYYFQMPHRRQKRNRAHLTNPWQLLGNNYNWYGQLEKTRSRLSNVLYWTSSFIQFHIAVKRWTAKERTK